MAKKSKPRSALPPVAVVVSTYNATVTERLREGAIAAYVAGGGSPEGIHVYPAPGAFELPAVAMAAAMSGKFVGVVALGCLIKGETPHDRIIADAVAGGLIDVTIASGVPVTFGVLTVDTAEQALARAGGAEGNKGADAMLALLGTIGSMMLADKGVRLSEDEYTFSHERVLHDKVAARRPRR
jgi:6,7-dimethyl-8-ribityllumazine synthase